MSSAHLSIRVLLALMLIIAIVIVWAWWYYRPTIEYGGSGLSTGITSMSIGQRWLRGAAIVLNVLAAGWWISVAIDVVSRMGWHVLATNSALLWFCFALPPITSLAALASAYRVKNANERHVT
jgi:signal transduction histidine kinase